MPDFLLYFLPLHDSLYFEVIVAPGLFEKYENIPLAERMRPRTIQEYLGQEHLLGEGKIIQQMITQKRAFSCILWGEPGTGKTTIARIVADACDMEAHFLSAIAAGVADVRKVIEKGKANRAQGLQTLLFLDEIHRFNKAQQDAVLGAVENGDVVLIGATTENPSFSVIAPLLSRTRVLKLNPLADDVLKELLNRALQSDAVFSSLAISMADAAADAIISYAGGDARRMYNLMETAVSLRQGEDPVAITVQDVDEAIRHSRIYYDKSGDRHYDTISAFIKSLRGSDPDAALHYLAVMILGGEDPLFIARRMIILASEDIGNASPLALTVATSAYQALKEIGMPEGEIILGHCATFLAASPKSNASYKGIKAAKEAARHDAGTIPMHLRNAPTKLMKELGYSEGYRYPHEYPGHFVPENYLPAELAGTVYYHPSDSGDEERIGSRLRALWPERYTSDKT